MNILFLYTKMAPYWLSCIKKLTAITSINVLIVKYKISIEAPFNFDLSENIRIIDFHPLIQSEVKNFQPDIVYVSGWINKKYNKLAKYFKNKGVPIICGMDNHWRKTIRQRLGILILKNTITKTFTHIWIPGMSQYEYAKRLGYKNHQILNNLYVGDVDRFNKHKIKVNTRFIFLGRLVKHKGIDILLSAFRQIKQQFKDAELIIIGEGEYAVNCKNQQGVKHLSFLQPEQVPAELAMGGIFILPSRYEAWGVALHEAAASGMPLISTYQCGAALHLIINGYNGFKINGGHIEQLFNVMKKILQKSNEELLYMAEKSRILANSITQEIWCHQLLSVVESR